MKHTRIPHALQDIDIPSHVDIQPQTSLDELMSYAGSQSLFGTGGRVCFGTAYLQGNRLMFTTAMPLQHLLDIAHVDRSKKTDNVEEVMLHSNRPAEPAHGKNLNQYLRDTACRGEKWIVPSITLNFGCDLSDDDHHVRLVILADDNVPGVTAWPAILIVPAGSRFDTTDGAHRETELEKLLADAKLANEAKDRLRQNALSVNFVFEASRADSHQDFADCAKGKAIAKSLVVTFDIRDEKNNISRDLVKGSSFLAAYVDATASNVNLSGKSTKVWSMSAVRTFTTHVAEQADDKTVPLRERMRQAAEFFKPCIEHIPVLKALAVNLTPKEDNEERPTTGQLRENRGGNVLLRGVGLSILARAYLDCKQFGIPFDTMARELAEVDWHILKIAKPSADDPDFREKIATNLMPLFEHMVSVGESRMKISSSSSDADIAWHKIILSRPALAAVLMEPEEDLEAAE